MVFRLRKLDVLLVVGICLAAIGVIFYFCFPLLFSYLLKQEISLVNGTVGYKVWQDIPLPIYQKLYFFNISNGEDFVRRGAKPRLTEVGPYTFLSKWTKKSIRWNSNGTVSFKEIRTFEFLRNESVGDENDQIITLNAPLLLATSFLKTYSLPVRIAASLLLVSAGERLVMKKSIRQLAFDGYRDIIILLSPLLKHNIPFKNGIFSWLYAKNGTDDGTYTVFTGQDDLANLNVIDNWNGEKTLDFWSAKSCNMINGSNAEISPPITPDQKTFTFFQSIFCRSMTLAFSEDVTHLGIRAKRFIATEATYGNKTINPDNACFVTRRPLLSGAQDISRCQYDAPIVISFPHFYLADPSYLKNFIGLQPNSSVHGFHIDVETNTGFSVDAAVRFQVNMYLERIPGFAQLQHIPKALVFPVFWTEIEFSLTDDMANLFKGRITRPKFIVNVLIWCFIAIGGLMMVLAGAMKYSVMMQSKKVGIGTFDDDEPLIDGNN